MAVGGLSGLSSSQLWRFFVGFLGFRASSHLGQCWFLGHLVGSWGNFTCSFGQSALADYRCEGGEGVAYGRRLSRVWLYSGRTCRGCSWAIGGTTHTLPGFWSGLSCGVLGVGFDCDEGGEGVSCGRRLSRVWLYSGRTCRGCLWAIGGTTLALPGCWSGLSCWFGVDSCSAWTSLTEACWTLLWSDLSVVDARCLAQCLPTLLAAPACRTDRFAQFADLEVVEAACMSSMDAVLRSIHRSY
jgi:hypothetical protein